MAAKIRSLQLWCKRQCEGYRDVEVTNMTSSWKSGLAFCAIIHRYRPDLIDYDSLSKENVYENNKLAFDVAQDSLNIAALLDPEDMVAMTVPDKLCIVTYVSQYYNYFNDKNPEGGPGVKACRAPTKRSSSAQGSAPEPKKITPTKSSSATHKTAGQTPMAVTSADNMTPREAPSKRGTYGDTCHLCRKKVYLMERHIEGSRLYHRRCFRDQQKSQRSPPVSSPGSQAQRPQPGVTSSAFQYPNSAAHRASHTTSNSALPSVPANSLVSAKTSSQAVSSSLQNSAQNSDKSNCSRQHDQWSGSKISNGINANNAVNNFSKGSQSTAGGSSLVKLLYGGPAPYGSSSTQESAVKQPLDSSPAKAKSPVNSSPKLGTSPAHQKSTVFSSNASVSKPSSVSQRAAMFDTGSKPKFGTAFTPQSQSPEKVSVTKPDNRTHALSSNAQSLFPRDVPKVSREPQPMEVDTPFPTNHSTHASASAAKPTVYASHTGVIDTTSDSGVKTGLFASLANIRQNKSADVNKTTSYLSQATVSTTTTRASSGPAGSTTTSIMRTPVTADNPMDESGHKSILKPASPCQSIDTSVHTNHHPILKTRLSDEGDQLATGPPRSILKHADNLPSDNEANSGSITAHAVAEPARSILKPNEPVEFHIDLGDHHVQSAASQPRSILKHGEDFSGRIDDKPASKSILKHDRVSGHPEGTPVSRSIFKSPDHSSTGTTSDIRSSAKPAYQKEKELNSSTADTRRPAMTNRPQSGSVVPAPRAQVKVTVGAKDTSSDRVRHNSPVSFLSKSNRTPSPRSILRKSDHSSANKGPDRPTGAKPWEKPKSDLSGAGPTISSSLSKKSAQPAVINNFSAFNLQDSLLLHEAKDDKAKGVKSASGLSIDKGKPASAKPTWQIEIEARTGVKTKRAAPARPLAPPQGSAANIHDLTNNQKPAPKESQPGKPEWQVEAERRTKIRDGKYQDPEFKHKYASKQNTPASSNGATSNVLPNRNSADRSSSNLKVKIPEKQSRHSMGNILDSGKVTKPPAKGVSDSNLSSNPPRPPPPRHKASSPETSRFSSPPHNYEMIWEPTHPVDTGGSPSSPASKLSRTPAFRISDSPESSPEIARSSDDNSRSHFYVEVNGNDLTKNKILPEVDFTFKSGDFEVNLNNPESPDLLPWGPMGQDTTRTSWIQQRPLPTPPGSVEVSGPIRRQVNAEARVSTLRIVRELEDLDKQLRALEDEGRCMEDKIRAVSDDQMDDEESMTAWFETVSKKNDLVRKESELMYKQRQQELEDVHTDLEHELRILMAKREHEKTASDRVRETSLIAELLETVNLRNNIVDRMEEDRIRYIQEDEEIQQMMVKTVTSNDSDKKKKKKKGDKRKKDTKEEKPAEPSEKKAQEKERKFFRKSIG